MSAFVGDWKLVPAEKVPSVGLYAMCDVYRRENYSTRYYESKAGDTHYFIDGVEVDEATFQAALAAQQGE